MAINCMFYLLQFRLIKVQLRMRQEPLPRTRIINFFLSFFFFRLQRVTLYRKVVGVCMVIYLYPDNLHSGWLCSQFACIVSSLPPPGPSALLTRRWDSVVVVGGMLPNKDFVTAEKKELFPIYYVYKYIY